MPSKFVKSYSLDVHDFGFMLPGLDDMLRLKKIYKNFKITCFTIPLPSEFFSPGNTKHFKEDKYKEWAKIINSYDWIEIGMHGFNHTHNECNIGYDKAIKLIEAGEKMFERVGLKYKKIYCAPYWQYSYDFLVALRDKGYVIAIDRNHPRPVPKDSKVYMYNWDLAEGIIRKTDIASGHGHTSGNSPNTLSRVYTNLLFNIKPDANFEFVTEACVE